VRKFRWVVTLTTLILVTHLGAEDIQLKDGTKMTGKLIAITGDVFQVKTAYGDINVPRSEMVSITFPENASKASGGGASLPPVDEELKGQTYTNRTADFQIAVPSGWKLAPELRTSKDIVAALTSSDETLFLMVTPEKFSGTLATYKVLAETQFQKNFTGYVNDGETEAQLDGHKGIRLIWHGTSKANNADIKS